MTANKLSSAARTMLAALMLGATLAACGGGGGDNSSVPSQPAAATELTVSAASTSATAGGAAVTLTAGLNGTGAISWVLASGSPGTLSATSGASVSYTPPALGSITTATTVTITASSGQLSKSIVLQLAPGNVPGLMLLAGTVSPGAGAVIDGAGSAARFEYTRALTADSNGVLYAANKDVDGGARIRRISSDGVVSTLASSAGGYPDGNLGPVLHISDINAMTAMADGSLYFSDTERTYLSSQVYDVTTHFRKLARDGTITTLGSTPRLPSDKEMRLVAGADGTVYVYRPCAIYTLGSDGSQTLLAGSNCESSQRNAVDGIGAAAQFAAIVEVRVNQSGTLYVRDFYSLRQVSKSGAVTTLLPLNFSEALAMSVNRDGDPLLLHPTDTPAPYEIRKFSAGALSTLYTIGTAASPARQYPFLMEAMADGSVITSDGSSLARIGTDGKAVLLAGVRDDSRDTASDGQGGDARLIKPQLLAVDHEGNIYSAEASVAYNQAATIRKTTPAGTVTTFASIDLQVGITGMVVTPGNALMVSVKPQNPLKYGGAIYQVEQGAKLTLIAGLPLATNTLQQSDGTGIEARFGGPALAGVDSAGNMYVYDIVAQYSSTTNLRKISAQGVVTTVDSLPAGLGAAPDGNVYQLNASGSGVYRVAPGGARTLVAGSGTESYVTVPGPLPAKLYKATSIVPLGERSFAIAAGNGIYKLTLP